MNFTPVFIYLLMYVCRLGGKRQEEVEAGGVIYQPGPTQSSFAQSLFKEAQSVNQKSLNRTPKLYLQGLCSRLTQ